MTTADNLNRIIQAKADIKTAIENKGVAVGDITIDGYAEKIGEIPQDASFSGLDFTVIGYDMTLTRELNDEFNAAIQYSLQKYNEWDSTVSYIGDFFRFDKKLVYAPLVDTHILKIMGSMFEGCTNLKTVPLFVTSNVTIMSSMFDGCSNLKTVPQFDTSKVTDMQYMFESCSNLKTVPLFDTSNVTDMSSMFDGCSNLKTVPLFDTSNVTDMSSMFDGCSNLKTVPQFDTSKVTDMQYIFKSCSNLKTVPLFDTSNVTNMGSMFEGCTNLTEVPLFDFSNVTNMQYFIGFSTLNNLTTLGGFKDLKVDWNDNYGLAKCPNLTYESVMNVINNLYDFRGNGDETTTKTIKFHPNSLALLSDDDKAIATNRGWVLS